MVGLWCYNQSGVTDLFIMRDSHYGLLCFKSVKTQIKHVKTTTVVLIVVLSGVRAHCEDTVGYGHGVHSMFIFWVLILCRAKNSNYLLLK